MDDTPLMLVALTVGAFALGALLGWLLTAHRHAARLHDAQLRAEVATARLAVGESGDADRFAALAAQVLDASTDRLLTVAEQRLRAEQAVREGEHAVRDAQLRALLQPLGTVLEQVQAQLGVGEQARAEGQALLGAQVRAMREDAARLHAQTDQLVTALRASQVRGRWGEVQLRRVVESAGMLDRVDFVEQDTARTDDGLLRPDLVVHLSGGKQVVVDAKVPFLGFLDAAAASSERVRTEGQAAHARQLRAHVDALAAKRYWEQFTPAPEFVVMFVPVESFLPAALAVDATIVEYAFDRHVVLATPTSLLALLRTVAYAWRQDALTANAQQVLDLGRQLHGRLATLGGHLTRLGRSLESAAAAYNQTVGSLESRVLVSARRFRALGVTDDPLPAPALLEPQLAVVSAPELTDDELTGHELSDSVVTDGVVALDRPA